MLWLRVNGQRHALLYNHALNCIEVREQTIKTPSWRHSQSPPRSVGASKVFAGL
ncbi:hypothetical protein [Singulisphaera sp. GP187]|uniref:hypothetical protein n=1 Tax=Singulisphaera sp. GP187 TaxID=1882752 RepID=UPI0039658265